MIFVFLFSFISYNELYKADENYSATTNKVLSDISQTLKNLDQLTRTFYQLRKAAQVFESIKTSVGNITYTESNVILSASKSKPIAGIESYLYIPISGSIALMMG